MNVDTFTVINVIANDTDPDGDYPLTLVSVGRASRGHASVQSSTSIRFSSGCVGGSTSIPYTVRDSRGATAQGTLSVIIRGNGCM